MRVRIKRLFLCILALHFVGITYYMAFIHPFKINDRLDTSRILSLGPIPFSVVSLANGSESKYSAKSFKSSHYHGPCEGITLPEFQNIGDRWNRVESSNNSYVFSAYYDEVGAGVIDIIGARTGYQNGYICQMWSRDAVTGNLSMKEVPARVVNLPEGHGRRFSATTFSCSVSRDHVPDYVSLITKKCQSPFNAMKVKRIKKQPYHRKFTVCVTPLNFRYGRAYELIEWIELNRILGADRFTFYNFSSANNVKSVLDYYSQLDLVEVVNWNLQMGVDTWPREGKPVEIHYFAQLAALNECWRRNKMHSKYLVYIDLDEFIVPHEKESRTWNDMFKHLPAAPSYMFRNVFYRKEWEDSRVQFTNSEKAKHYMLVTLTKTLRENYTFPYNMRSKYIISSTSAKTVGIHNLPNGQSPHRVPDNIGHVHHYRNWEKYDDKKARHQDTIIISKYGQELITNVEKVWSELKGVKMDVPIT